MNARKLWIALAIVMAASFAVLGFVGYRSIKSAPPVVTVVSSDGRVLFDGETIRDGQNVWQSLGGQQIGSIWGHGAYVAPDWSADWIHREARLVLDEWARADHGASYDALDEEKQAALRVRLVKITRTNGFDEAKGAITIDAARARAFDVLAAHYADVFANGRAEYAIPRGTLIDQAKQRQMAAFFFWTAWAATADRPGESISYTQNWPHEPLVANVATSGTVMWSVISVIVLLAGIAALVWHHAAHKEPVEDEAPARDPLLDLKPTPSQKATLKYFLVVAALWLAQIGLGALTAHYGVEGNGFFGIPLDQILPYSVTRTWHIQIGIFWIATSWLATGLFVAPAVSGVEPKGQKLGVNLLFGALLLVVVGSLTGELLSAHQKLGTLWFWFGHQGYEYVDLGRVWQILLLIGLLFWLFLVARALLPALKRRDAQRPLLLLFALSAVAIPTFYAAGLMYGQRSHLVTAEYWRWWVVHLWVEGFFEVFATVVIAFLFTRLRLLSVKTATTSVLFSTVIFLTGGILGTFHHLYFTGTKSTVLALGSVFSALEIVPLCLVGFEAVHNLRLARGEGGAPRWLQKYRWPILFFVSVAFWNLVGAGLFGFLINPPIALYYMQGLNTTAVHGHTALFGVYGMLGLGLTLFCLRAASPTAVWNERPLKLAFYTINAGLVAMVVFSMLPIGVAQAWAAVEHGTWYARSPEFLQTPTMQTLRWLRGVGDTLFAVGALALAAFVIRRTLGREDKVATDDHSAVPPGDIGVAPAE